MSSSARKISGKASTTKSGRPRAVTDRVWLNILVLNSTFKERGLREHLKKIGKPLNGKRVVQILAESANVTERVIKDIINFRGAYSNPPVSKETIKKVEFNRWSADLKERVERFERESDV